MRSRWLRPVVAAPGSWDPDLHPRARDGKFIEVLGFINALIDGKWMRAQVTSIVPDKASPKNPDIFIDVMDEAGKRIKSAKVKSANVSTAAKAKALLHKAEFTPRTWATTWKNAAELDEHIAGLAPADRLEEFEHNAGVPRSPSLPSRLKKMSDPDLKATFEAIDDATDKDIAREVKIEMARRGFADKVVEPKVEVLDTPQAAVPEPEKLPEVAPADHVWDSGATFIFQTAGIDPASAAGKSWVKQIRSSALALDSKDDAGGNAIRDTRNAFMEARLKQLGLSNVDAASALKWINTQVEYWVVMGGMSKNEELYPVAEKLFSGAPMTTPNEIAVQALYEYTQAVLKVKYPKASSSRVVRVVGGYQGVLLDTAHRLGIDIELATRPLSSWSVERGLPSLRSWLGGRQQVWQEVDHKDVLVAFWGDERLRTKDVKAKGEYILWSGKPISTASGAEIVIDTSREDHYNPGYYTDGMYKKKSGFREVNELIDAMEAAGRLGEVDGEWLDKAFGATVVKRGGGNKWFPKLKPLISYLNKNKDEDPDYSAALKAFDAWRTKGFGHWELEQWSDERRVTRWDAETLLGEIRGGELEDIGLDEAIVYLKRARERGKFATFPYKTPASQLKPWDELPDATPDQLKKLDSEIEWKTKLRSEKAEKVRAYIATSASGPESAVDPAERVHTIVSGIEREAHRLLEENYPWLAAEMVDADRFTTPDLPQGL